MAASLSAVDAANDFHVTCTLPFSLTRTFSKPSSNALAMPRILRVGRRGYGGVYARREV